MSISYFENGFSVDDYIEERNQKESNVKGSNKTGKDSASAKAQSTVDNSGSGDSDMDDEEEDEIPADWNRAEAERIYANTRSTLNTIYTA